MSVWEYPSLVFRDYETKKAAKSISSRLMQPTTANLRDECIAICPERFTKRDQGILRTFFGEIGSDATTSIQAIKKCDLDKFRPLVNFLKKGGSNETNVKNIDLLAWLIDYKDRPFGSEQRMPARNDDDQAELVEKEVEPQLRKHVLSQEENGSEQNAEPSGKGRGRDKIDVKKVAIVCLILFPLIIAVYWIWSNNSSKTGLNENERCMYWAGNHYQPISCNEKLKDNTLVIALDSQKLNHFKRITTPDTITIKSIGRVWYTKVGGNIEFYTSDGFHPVDIRLRLKPVTDYIINKYIYADKSPK